MGFRIKYPLLSGVELPLVPQGTIVPVTALRKPKFSGLRTAKIWTCGRYPQITPSHNKKDRSLAPRLHVFVYVSALPISTQRREGAKTPRWEMRLVTSAATSSGRFRH